jgi:hypothetical protein
MTINGDLTAVGLVQPTNERQKRGFAAPASADDAQPVV